jgi:tetratricopeptide (TPR) repeat protein
MSTIKSDKKLSDSVNKAFKLFYDKKFEKAGMALKKIIENDTLEGWEKNRLGQYVEICETYMNSDEVHKSLDSLPDSLGSISILLNEKHYDIAGAMIDRMDLTAGTKFYLKAEMAVEQELFEEAVDFLNQAIAENPINKGIALNSPSFNPHLSDEHFEFLKEE